MIFADGIQPAKRKTDAVSEARLPKIVSQLRSFLGMVNSYCKFLDDFSHVLAPLHRLLNKTTTGRRGKEEAVFKTVKDKLSKAPVLEHIAPEKPLGRRMHLHIW